MEPISRAIELNVGYRKNFPILENCNLEIYLGEMIALLGPNGSGKSTLIRTWCGLQKQLSGKIVSIPEVSFSLVPQVKNINFGFPMSVKDTLLLPRKAKTFFKKVKFTLKEEELLEKSGITNILYNQISQCSGGQLQKVLIVRSLFSYAKIIFLDEPMDALDPTTTQTMLEVLKSFKKENQMSFFLITHNASQEFLDNFDRVFEIQLKQIVQKK
jgi:manganese/zinc/iron transport system ATP- binding protein